MEAKTRRQYVIAGVYLLLIVVILAKLFYVQIIDDRFKILAQNNSIRKIITHPPRGLIYDRDQKLLVRNIPIYDIKIVPGELSRFDTSRLASVLGIDTTFIRTQIKSAKEHSLYKPSIFLKNINKEVYARFQEHLYEFAGFYPEAHTTREYQYEGAAHTLGYLGEIDVETLQLDTYYQGGDYVGLCGVEKSYEKVLRGVKGEKLILVDVLNREQGSLDEGNLDIDPVNGFDIKLTLDIDLQTYGERLMKGKRGSIVAIEPKTGNILSLVSSPTYDPNLLNTAQRGNYISQLNNDPNKPLFNRALMARYPPGSTLKPLIALIALEEEVIAPNYYYPCNRYYYINKMVLRCSHNHPSARNVAQAIQHSCNPYFWDIFRKTLGAEKFLRTSNALNIWTNHFTSFGIGGKSFVDLPDEKRASIPSSTLYDKMYGRGKWGATTIISLGIGQGEFALTPLQLANYTAILANRGTYFYPHVVETNYQKNESAAQYQVERKGSIDVRHYEPIIDGMSRVVRFGKANYAFDPALDVCGKTGTAQNAGEDHSLFIAFAPKDDPKIALAVIVENGGYGYSNAAPIAAMMIEQYLTDTVLPIRQWIEKKIINTNLLTPASNESQ